MNLTEQLLQQFSTAAHLDRGAIEDMLASQERQDPPNKHAAWYRRQYEKVGRSLRIALQRIDELEAELKALKEGEE